MIENLLELGIKEVMPDPSQPRKTFLDDEISRLAASVAARGILQPIRVTRDEQRKCWVILTGESRWRAAQLAGLKTVPCIVVQGELSEADKLADRLTENGVRNDIPPLEEAVALARLKALKGCNSKTLVEEYGFSGAFLTRAESLLRLPPEIQAMVGTGPDQVPPSAAYEISRLDDPQGQLEWHMPSRASGSVGTKSRKPSATASGGKTCGRNHPGWHAGSTAGCRSPSPRAASL